MAQRYSRWQLVVVVDGDDDAVAAVTAVLPDDDRIDVVRSTRGGVSAARNVGLDAARGELVAYLDDDNLMGPLWTKAIAWAAGRQPDVQLFYGAELVDAPPNVAEPAGSPCSTSRRSTAAAWSGATTSIRACSPTVARSPMRTTTSRSPPASTGTSCCVPPPSTILR